MSMPCPQRDRLREAILKRDIDDFILANILEVLDELARAESAIDKALSALATNPVTGDRTAYAVLKAHRGDGI